MKRFILSLSAAFVLTSGLTELQAQGRKFSLPQNAVQIEDGAYYLGRGKDRDGSDVEGIAFVHPRAGAAKGGGGKPPAGGSTCFAFMSSGARWKTLEPYVVDARNRSGMDSATVSSVIDAGLGLWESAAGKPIFGPLGSGEGNGADTIQPDNLNEFLFAEIDDPGVIAVTIVWGRFSGPPHSRELVEWDMICDDVEYTWGSAGETNEGALGDTLIMDFQAIFQHEAGHAAGLSHPSSTCTEETMYAYASTGETKKRTLHTGDIEGIRALYK